MPMLIRFEDKVDNIDEKICFQAETNLLAFAYIRKKKIRNKSEKEMIETQLKRNEQESDER